MARAHRLLPRLADLAMKLEEVSFDELGIGHPLTSAFERPKTVSVFPAYQSCGSRKFAAVQEQAVYKLDPNFRNRIYCERRSLSLQR